MSLRDQIFAVDDVATEVHDVPEWDLKIQLRSMSLIERERIGELSTKRAEAEARGVAVDPSFFAALLVACAFDPETGEQIFTAEDIPALNRKSGAVTGRLAIEAMRVSGMTDEAKSELGKDSPSPAADSSSS